MSLIAIVFGVFILSLFSGMLGLGAAFATIPYLSFFMSDIVHEVQPVALLLNGFTAAFSAFGFARSGLIRFRDATLLAITTTASAPIGSFIVQHVQQIYVWIIYFSAVIYLAYRLFRPIKSENVTKNPNLKLALVLAVPISILAGFLGVGPGFLLMPTLIIVGYEPKVAAGINAIAVCPPSFSAFIPHMYTMKVSTSMLAYIVITGSIASYIGARITAKYITGHTLRKIFGSLIVILTAYRLLQFFS
uniref:Probable membrane transporter protein n=1 Tax=Archaeoglobus fulgidus TaxID=2234 RepID=A0A7J2TKA6_ARCFL